MHKLYSWHPSVRQIGACERVVSKDESTECTFHLIVRAPDAHLTLPEKHALAPTSMIKGSHSAGFEYDTMSVGKTAEPLYLRGQVRGAVTRTTS